MPTFHCKPEKQYLFLRRSKYAQLQQHIVDLHKQAPKDTSSPTHSPPSPSMVPPRNSSCQTPNSIPQRRSTDDYPNTGSGASAANGLSGTMPCPVNSSIEEGNSTPHRALYSASADEESSEEQTKKKFFLLSASLTDSFLTPFSQVEKNTNKRSVCVCYLWSDWFTWIEKSM